MSANATEALRESLAQVIAEQRRDWTRERTLIEEQAARTIADLRARIAELEAVVTARINERLAAIKDGVDGRDGKDGINGQDGKDGRDGADGADGKDGSDGTNGRDAPILEDVIAALQPGVRAYLEAIPAPKDGTDGRDGVDGAPGRDGAAGADGKDGTCVTLADIAPVLRELVAAMPVPKDGRDGRDAPAVTPDDVIAAVRASPAAIQSAVAEYLALNPPAPGRDGKDGERGEKGDQGDQGPAGENGVGCDSVDLELSPDGKMATLSVLTGDIERRFEFFLPVGPPGEQGVKGEDGKPGERGADGAPGKMVVAVPFSERVHYEGEIVTDGGSTWQARRDTGKAPPHDDWICLASSGRDGADGKSLNPCGLFDEHRQYAVLDIVMLNGASFVARRDNPGSIPGSGWLLLAKQGARGPKGEPGDRGLPGEPGKPGEAILGMAVDGTVLKVANDNGSVVECDLYDVLAKVAR